MSFVANFHPHWLGHWLIQQLVLPYKPWYAWRSWHNVCSSAAES